MSQPLLELGGEKVPEVQGLGPINRGTCERPGVLSAPNTPVGRSDAGSRTADLPLSLPPAPLPARSLSFSSVGSLSFFSLKAAK